MGQSTPDRAYSFKITIDGRLRPDEAKSTEAGAGGGDGALLGIIRERYRATLVT